MFLNFLNQTQSSAFLEVARRLMTSDGDFIAEEERNLIDLLKKEMNYVDKHDFNNSDLSISKLLSYFDTLESKISLLLELIGLANVDNDYSDEERAYIKMISESLDIQSEKLYSMEGWVKKQFDLFNEAKSFMILGE